MECKNIECENETTGKRIYCSLTCRNVFVNKYLRNYDKVSLAFEQKKKVREIEYLKDPKRCKFCNEIISFSKKNDNYSFCSHSCSASFNNKSERSEETKVRISNGIKNFIKINGIFGALSPKNSSHETIKICTNCDGVFSGKNKLFCSDKCRKIFNSIGVNKYSQYRVLSNFKFNLSDYKEEFDFILIEKYGWYSPSNKKNNLDGVSRDHMLSVREGFELGIDPKLISHPANCRLIKHTDNISKNKKSIITNEELLERIRKFEEKYNIKTNE